MIESALPSGFLQDIRFALRGLRNSAGFAVAAIFSFTLAIGAATATTRVLASFLFKLTPNDPATFCLSAGTLLAVTLIAGYLPARLDPMATLREE